MTKEPDVTPDGTAETPATTAGGEAAPSPPATGRAAAAPDTDAAPDQMEPEEGEQVEGEVVEGELLEADQPEPATDGTGPPDTTAATAATAETAETAADDEEPTPAVPAGEAPGGFAAELAALRTELDERTRDLQRVTAEYANYRKRVERDRELIGQQATASVISALLPVLDDLDRAREHGELAEGVAAVVDQLVATTAKFGLTAFGEKGDPFDPNRHEAVAHLTSPEVSEPTCIDVLRRGYLLGDRLLRPAMVAVADPD